MHWEFRNIFTRRCVTPATNSPYAINLLVVSLRGLSELNSENAAHHFLFLRIKPVLYLPEGVEGMKKNQARLPSCWLLHLKLKLFNIKNNQS